MHDVGGLVSRNENGRRRICDDLVDALRISPRLNSTREIQGIDMYKSRNYYSDTNLHMALFYFLFHGLVKVWTLGYVRNLFRRKSIISRCNYILFTFV